MTTINQKLYSPGVFAYREAGCRMKRHVLMATLLLFAVAIVPGTSFAHNVSGGCDDGKKAVTIKSDQNWLPLCSVTLDLSDGVHTCVATASAYVPNTVGDIHNEYRFTIDKKKNPTVDGAGELRIDLNQDTSGTDLKDQPVSVAQHFDDLKARTRTFYWLARKLTSDADNIDARRFSMGVVCTDGK